MKQRKPPKKPSQLAPLSVISIALCAAAALAMLWAIVSGVPVPGTGIVMIWAASTLYWTVRGVRAELHLGRRWKLTERAQELSDERNRHLVRLAKELEEREKALIWWEMTLK